MNLIPVPKDESECAVQAPLGPVDLGISRESLLEVAQELGLKSFTPSKLLAIHSAGTAMKKVGVLKIGRTMLYRAMEGSETGLTQCEEALGSIEDPESRAALLPTKLGFAKELRESATAFIKSAELDGNDDSDNRGKVKPFAPGALAGPVFAVQQAVVTVNNNAE
jgi:hypothetical protein